MTTFPWLSTIVLFPLLASLLIPWLPDRKGTTVRWYALGVGLIDFALIAYAFGCYYDLNNMSLQFVEDIVWLERLHLHWSLGVDGLSMPLILLTGFITIPAKNPVATKKNSFCSNARAIGRIAEAMSE